MLVRKQSYPLRHSPETSKLFIFLPNRRCRVIKSWIFYLYSLFLIFSDFICEYCIYIILSLPPFNYQVLFTSQIHDFLFFNYNLITIVTSLSPLWIQPVEIISYCLKVCRNNFLGLTDFAIASNH